MKKALTAFDRLDEVRSAARARAVEDFEFFCSGVLGFKVRIDIAQELQRLIISREDVTPGIMLCSSSREAIQVDRAVTAWKVVLGLSGEIVEGPSETFEWLFPEVARRAA